MKNEYLLIVSNSDFITILPHIKCTKLEKLFFVPNFSNNKFSSHFDNVRDLKRKYDNDHVRWYERLVY